MEKKILNYGRRHIIKASDYTFMISLPKSWIKSNRLTNKIWVNIYLNDKGDLVISPPKLKRYKNVK